MNTHRLPCAAALAVLFTAPLLTADVLDKTKSIGGTTVHYKVILPPHYDAAKAYPGILAFGGGSQTMQIVEGTITRFWREQAEQRGYIVILPAAPTSGATTPNMNLGMKKLLSTRLRDDSNTQLDS
jgi:hypothetical protein